MENKNIFKAICDELQTGKKVYYVYGLVSCGQFLKLTKRGLQFSDAKNNLSYWNVEFTNRHFKKYDNESLNKVLLFSGA